MLLIPPRIPMGNLSHSALSFLNRLVRRVPRGVKRGIADFPGVLGLFERFYGKDLAEIRTPEGFRLAVNPWFHSNLVAAGDLGAYEPETRGAILRLTRPGMTAYDIGANVGIFSFLFASIVKDGTVYAFEPERNNYLYFEKSLAMNGARNIVLDRRAIGRATETARFDRRGGAFSGRLVGDRPGYKPTRNIARVETVSVDFLVAEEGYRAPDIVKIDVEGNEYMVLEGMRNILMTHGPIIICELHTHLGEKSERVLELLHDCGYAVSPVGSSTTTEKRDSAPAELSRETHITAIKQTSPSDA